MKQFSKGLINLWSNTYITLIENDLGYENTV